MNNYFDELIDRTNTNSLKYDFALERGKPQDILPLWVADMDFKAPPAVLDVLTSASAHGIFGYTETKTDYFKTLHHWFNTYFNWSIEDSWLVKTPGVVYAICTAIRSLTKKGDAVMIQQPVYYPFAESITSNERLLINNSLVYKDGKYFMDLQDFEDKIIKHKVKLFILCSPHNPVGRVWTKEELIALGDICLKHGVLIISDEIHADFVYEGYQHHILASLKPEFLDITITCTAPSKTFNLAGLQVSNIFIPNESIRTAFEREIVRTGYSQLNTMGLLACKAAYDYGREWLDDLKAYLAQNLEFVRTFLQERLPQIKLVEPQGTYLIWLDCKALNLTDEALDDLIVHKAGLWLDTGSMFGSEGEGFQRINIACPRAILEKALSKLESAISTLN